MLNRVLHWALRPGNVTDVGVGYLDCYTDVVHEQCRSMYFSSALNLFMSGISSSTMISTAMTVGCSYRTSAVPPR